MRPNKKDWSKLLEDALWAHRTAYQTPLGMSPYRVVFGKACHLPVNFDLDGVVLLLLLMFFPMVQLRLKMKLPEKSSK